MKMLVFSQGAEGKATEALVQENHEVNAVDMDSCALQRNEKLSTNRRLESLGEQVGSGKKRGGEKSVGSEI